jgi:hypothetical protein
MSSQSFNEKKIIGRWFESEVDKVLASKGAEFIDSENLKYTEKKGFDRLVKFKGEEAKLEIKFDVMAENTDNVCVESSALNQSQSPIWIYGIPTNRADYYTIDLYTMYLNRLKSFVAKYPVRLLGEFKAPCHLIPRDEFISAEDDQGKVVNHFYELKYEDKPEILTTK